MQLLTRTDVAKKLGYKSYVSLSAVINDPSFPKPVPGLKGNRWIDAEVDVWILNQTKKRETA